MEDPRPALRSFLANHPILDLGFLVAFMTAFLFLVSRIPWFQGISFSWPVVGPVTGIILFIFRRRQLR